MSRFYVEPGSVRGDSIVVTGDEAHHIIDVMRLKVGDDVVAFDGLGREYSAIIEVIGKKDLTLRIKARHEGKAMGGLSITLIQAIPKSDRMDYIVEKSTELGTRVIAPVFTDRTIAKWDSKKTAARLDRWKNIAMAASKQCGRSDIPDVREASIFDSALAIAADTDIKLIAALSDRAKPLKEVLAGRRAKSAAIAIGPEGDFTAREVRTAEDAGFIPVSLGQLVLRSDTAGLAVISILNYEYGNK